MENAKRILFSKESAAFSKFEIICSNHIQSYALKHFVVRPYFIIIILIHENMANYIQRKPCIFSDDFVCLNA